MKFLLGGGLLLALLLYVLHVFVIIIIDNDTSLLEKTRARRDVSQLLFSGQLVNLEFFEDRSQRSAARKHNLLLSLIGKHVRAHSPSGCRCEDLMVRCGLGLLSCAACQACTAHCGATILAAGAQQKRLLLAHHGKRNRRAGQCKGNSGVSYERCGGLVVLVFILVLRGLLLGALTGRGELPQAYDTVLTAGGEAGGILSKNEAAHGRRVAREALKTGSTLEVPELDAGTCREHTLAVAADAKLGTAGLSNLEFAANHASTLLEKKFVDVAALSTACEET
mmetsp:Transcript_9027/g.17804  ORF Transcript_9027/g.17804 Transcript_9027/m.17804 type:complete len:280 (+) Transcript_9027:1206-2045(+)